MGYLPTDQPAAPMPDSPEFDAWFRQLLALIAPKLALVIVSAMWLYWGSVTFRDNHGTEETYH